MHTGIKFIPLRTPGGELIPGSGLFVRIKKAATAVAPTKTVGESTSGEVQEAPRIRRISRPKKQLSFNLDDGIFEEIEEEEGRSELNDGIDEVPYFSESDEDNDTNTASADDTIDNRAVPRLLRRFSSPALLDNQCFLKRQPDHEYCSSDEQGGQLTAIAEVYEDAVGI